MNSKISTAAGIFIFIVIALLTPIPKITLADNGWDILLEDWDTDDGTWQIVGSGESIISGTRSVSGGYLINTPNNSKAIRRDKNIGPLPETGYTVEFRAKMKYNETGSLEYWFRDGMHLNGIKITENKVSVKVSYGMVSKPIRNEEDVFYTWRLVIDSDNHAPNAVKVRVLRDGITVLEVKNPLYDYKKNDGLVHVAQTENKNLKSGAESTNDYLYIKSGLYNSE